MELNTKDIQRLSHSFPPDYEHNCKYLANVHHIIGNTKLNIDSKRIYYRPIKNAFELKEVKLLHKEWFPPDYPDAFFNAVLNHNTYRSILALYDISYKNKKTTIILGCLLYELKELEFEYVRHSIADWFQDRMSLYILTFGVINEARNKGVGRGLLQKLIQIANQNSNVACIYLDVVVYNDQGINCYEKNGFQLVARKKNYYDIFDKEYDAFMYYYYVNGAKPPLHLKEKLFGCLQRLSPSHPCRKRKQQNYQKIAGDAITSASEEEKTQTSLP